MIGIIVSLIAFGVAVKQNPGVNIQDVLDSTSQINIQTNAKIMEEAYVVNG